MNNSNTAKTKDSALRTRSRIGHNNWMFEIEPYSRQQTETLADVRDNLRLKKHLKRAVESEFAPLSLIESIRAGITA